MDILSLFSAFVTFMKTISKLCIKIISNDFRGLELKEGKERLKLTYDL